MAGARALRKKLEELRNFASCSQSGSRRRSWPSSSRAATARRQGMPIGLVRSPFEPERPAGCVAPTTSRACFHREALIATAVARLAYHFARRMERAVVVRRVGWARPAVARGVPDRPARGVRTDHLCLDTSGSMMGARRRWRRWCFSACGRRSRSSGIYLYSFSGPGDCRGWSSR